MSCISNFSTANSCSIKIGGKVGAAVSIGSGAPLAFICGPCVIESRDHAMMIAESLTQVRERLRVPFIYKSSYDKANRTSAESYRGMGIDEGLRILSDVKSAFGCPIVTDVHSPEECRSAASVVDLLQIPAFLCRQTDLLSSAGSTGLPVMIKKGQFLHPTDMKFAAEKVISAGGLGALLCERGTCFGYRDLVVDMRGLKLMRDLGHPVVFDATHSVQQMGGHSGKSGGSREFVPLLARAAVACGVDAVFLETHNDPDSAPSDGPNMIPLNELGALISDLQALSELHLSTR